MRPEIRPALVLISSSTARERTVDIATTGRRSGEPHRIEIWCHRVAGTNCLSGLPATARLITEAAERHLVLGDIVEDLDQPHNPARIIQPTLQSEWKNGSPPVEIDFGHQAAPNTGTITPAPRP